MNYKLRKPTQNDGFELHQLVKRAGKLDTNSIYCNLLQSAHFNDTAIVAESEGELVGSVTGYRLPNRPDTLFVWQVAVDPRFRGQGLASKMLEKLASDQIEQGVSHIETTITRDNLPSRKLFTRFFERYGSGYSTRAYFESQAHFQGEAATEYLYRSDLSLLAEQAKGYKPRLAAAG